MMRTTAILSLIAGVCAATTLPVTDLELINRLDTLVRYRFEDPVPDRLGMSRVAFPPSFGAHFRPKRSSQRDFEPELPPEQEVIAALEERQIQVGF